MKIFFVNGFNFRSHFMLNLRALLMYFYHVCRRNFFADNIVAMALNSVKSRMGDDIFFISHTFFEKRLHFQQLPVKYLFDVLFNVQSWKIFGTNSEQKFSLQTVETLWPIPEENDLLPHSVQDCSSHISN